MEFIYTFFKLPARLALKIYAKKWVVNQPEAFSHEGPLLLACNHPNSFLDAILLSAHFDLPIHSLARGDAFKKGFSEWFIRVMHMLPVYRTSEGAHNLEQNYDTFESCKEVFRKNGAVLIFSEGLCVNEWHLRSLKKGTARLAVSAWDEGIPLKILPVGINYHSFTSTEKIIHINFGEVFTGTGTEPDSSEGKKLTAFNNHLKNELQKLVYEIPEGDVAANVKVFGRHESILKKILLFVPAMIGFAFHYFYYKALQNFVHKKAAGTGHKDSILLGLLFFSYPVFLIIISIIAGIFLGWWWLAVWVALPFTAWSMVQWKDTGGYAKV